MLSLISMPNDDCEKWAEMKCFLDETISVHIIKVIGSLILFGIMSHLGNLQQNFENAIEMLKYYEKLRK